MPGCEVRVVDLQMNDVPRDMQAIGEVVMRGDNIMDGYYKEPKATAAVMTDGWLHTGDMAVWDEENYIHIVDRKKDIIISGGENISSIEVERAIFAHPAVLECAVVSAPDAQWGEVPAAFVVLKPGQTLDQHGALRIPAAAHRQIQDAPPLSSSAIRRCPRPAPARSSSANCARRSGAEKKPASKDEPIMWQQTYTPIGDSLGLSALVAAIPIFTLLFLLGVLRKPAWMASLAGLGRRRRRGRRRLRHAGRTARRRRHLRRRLRPLSHRLGRLQRDPALPHHARERQIRNPEGLHRHLTNDPRLQALLIAFAFGAFIEGAAGFGTPVAVAAAMLTGLGFSPFYAAAICLLANTAPVAFGSIAIPITTLAVTTGLPLDRLSAGVGRICAPVSLFVPAYLILVMSGWKGLQAACCPPPPLCGIAFAGTQFLVSNYMGPQLTDILSSLAAMGALLLVIKRRGGPPSKHSGRADPARLDALCAAGRLRSAVGHKPFQACTQQRQHPGAVAGPAQPDPAHAARGRQARAVSRGLQLHLALRVRNRLSDCGDSDVRWSRACRSPSSDASCATPSSNSRWPS